MAYTLRVRSAQNFRKLYSLEHAKLWHTLYEFAQLKIFEQLIRLAYIYLRKSFFFRSDARASQFSFGSSLQ